MTNEINPPQLDSSSYDGHEKWTNRRWAWEFLCRNESFKSECDTADKSNDKDKKIKVAQIFGLRTYKSYKSPYKEKMPRFMGVHVAYLSNTTNQTKKNVPSWLPLKFGQVVMRFELIPIIKDAAYLKSQISDAKRILSRLSKEIESSQVPTEKFLEAKGKGSKSIYLRHIKLLDMLEKGATHEEALIAANPSRMDDRTNTLTPKEKAMALKESASSQISLARFFANENYINVALNRKKASGRKKSTDFESIQK